MTFEPALSGIELWPSFMSVPGLSPVVVPPMPALSVCTVGVEELSDRTDRGEEHFDVIEEHTSWFFFRNREGYEIARGIARNILRGNLVKGDISAGIIGVCPTVDGMPSAPIVMCLSAHHIYAEPVASLERLAREGMLGRAEVA